MMPLCHCAVKHNESGMERCHFSPAGGLRVFLHWKGEAEEQYQTYMKGTPCAEEICIDIAQKIGITPICFSLFALYDPQTKLWFPPNYVFDVDSGIKMTLHFRMRYYFRNWHGTNDKEPAVYRSIPRSADSEDKSYRSEQGSALLDKSSFAYLFEQGKYDFINDVASLKDMRTEQEIHQFKNESLGMAVLHLCHLALKKGISLEEVAERTSFKECIPRSFCRQIQQNNSLTKFRMKNVFKKFLHRFQQHTVSTGKLTEQDLMHKYLATLENLAPRFGTELFAAVSLETVSEGEKMPLYINGGHTHLENSCASPPGSRPVTHEVLVTGISGIQWRPIPAEVGSFVGSSSCNSGDLSILFLDIVRCPESYPGGGVDIIKMADVTR